MIRIACAGSETPTATNTTAISFRMLLTFGCSDLSGPTVISRSATYSSDSHVHKSIPNRLEWRGHDINRHRQRQQSIIARMVFVIGRRNIGKSRIKVWLSVGTLDSVV